MKGKTLILGIGNDILKDDGIGPLLVHDLALMNTNPDMIYNVACCGGLEIMEYIRGYEKVIFIDAIRTLNGKPGDIYYFTPSDFRETGHLSNLHDIYFLIALKLGTILELNLPVDLHIIAVEIVEDKEFGEELTIPMKKEYPSILEEVLVIVNKITK